jgi:hypothetical protein
MELPEAARFSDRLGMRQLLLTMPGVLMFNSFVTAHSKKLAHGNVTRIAISMAAICSNDDGSYKE